MNLREGINRYVALLERDRFGGWGLTVPDFPGFTDGGRRSAAELLDTAAEGLLGHVEVMIEEGIAVPDPRTLDDLKADPAFAEDFAGAEMVTTVPLLPVAGQKTRAHLSMDRAVLAAIDAEAKRLKMDRSEYLTAAARHLMAQG
jgi:predicted RNase H-like HicB family nuclease